MCQEHQRQQRYYTGVESGGGGAHAAGVRHGGAGEGAARRHGVDERAGDVAQAQGHHLLSYVQLLTNRKSLCDGNIGKHHDYREHEDAAAEVEHHVLQPQRAVVQGGAERRQREWGQARLH